MLILTRHEQGMEAVYTWVDDCFPGYMEMLHKHSSTRNDLNPNRTRDNLNILKYSLRSLQIYAPWVDKVTLISMSPQVPDWINTGHPDIRILHHHDFIPEVYLPTFSSFSIISHFHRLEPLPNRFVYFEDDMVLGCPISEDIFFNEAGLINVWFKNNNVIRIKNKSDEDTSPWNFALDLSNDLLDKKYGHKNRKMMMHSPLVIDREIWAKLHNEWPEYFERTAQSKFRSVGNIAPEFLYGYYLVNEGFGNTVSAKTSHLVNDYWGLENNRFFNAIGLFFVKLKKRPFITLNDNFGYSPKPSVVNAVTAYLEKQYPIPSKFEQHL